MRAALYASAATLALLLAAPAQALVVSAMPNQALGANPFVISLGGGAATYAFTLAPTGNGDGAAVATGGTGLVSSLFGTVSDFGFGATIDQNGQIYGFSAFPSPETIPNSAADDFIGLAFTLADGIHYGYAEVAGPALVSYGFETSPGVSITTGAVPEPASALLILTGLGSLALIRKRPA